MKRIERVEPRRGTPPVRLDLLSAAEREFERSERERRRRRRAGKDPQSPASEGPSEDRPRLDVRG